MSCPSRARASPGAPFCARARPLTCPIVAAAPAHPIVRRYLQLLLERYDEAANAGGRPLTTRDELGPRLLRRAYDEAGAAAKAKDTGVEVRARGELHEQVGQHVRGEQRAAELLKETEDKVSAIAAQVGWLEHTHFDRAFKAHYGLSPSDYRKDIAADG